MLSTALLATGMALNAATAHAEPLTCQGQAVTVEGDTGTEGDDVMLVGPAQRSARAGEGNDVVCLRLGDDLRADFFLDAGPGDDVAHNETTDSERGVSAVLGAGADSYVGSDHSSDGVSTGPDLWGGTADTEEDVVETRGGRDSVATGSVTPGTPNPDVISTGADDDSVTWAGEQVGAPVDLGAGENRLSLKSGWAGDAIDIDATAGLVTADSRPVLRWSKEVTAYTLEYTHLRTTFNGSGLDEYLTFWPSQADQQGPDSSVSDPQLRLDADMGGGDDRLEMLDSAGGSWVGGAGRDRLGGPRCLVADVRLGRSYECKDNNLPALTSYTSTIDVWEAASVAGGRLRVIGSNGSDTIRAYGRTAYVDGLGGRDVLASSGQRTARKAAIPVVIRGGPGADRITSGYSDEQFVGGGGNDVIAGGPGEDQLVGGAGRDRLSGGQDDDRIVGGAGRDRADGGPGSDRCSVEVRRSCELR